MSTLTPKRESDRRLRTLLEAYMWPVTEADVDELAWRLLGSGWVPTEIAPLERVKVKVERKKR